MIKAVFETDDYLILIMHVHSAFAPSRKNNLRIYF